VRSVFAAQPTVDKDFHTPPQVWKNPKPLSKIEAQKASASGKTKHSSRDIQRTQTLSPECSIHRFIMPGLGKNLAVLSQRIVVHEHDVLNGRGVNVAQHPGNQRFRALVKSRSNNPFYSRYTRSAKIAVAEEIIHHIRNLSPPGRFLKHPSSVSNAWEKLTDKETLKKTCQALRDCSRVDRAEYAPHLSTPEDAEVSSAGVRNATALTNQASVAPIASGDAEHIPAASILKPEPVFSEEQPPAGLAAAPEHHIAESEEIIQPLAKAFTMTPKTTTPATVASSGGFQFFPDRSETASLTGEEEEDAHSLDGTNLPYTENPFPGSPIRSESAGFHSVFEDDQKLPALAPVLGSVDTDLDEGGRESAEAILGRSLDEGIDFGVDFDTDYMVI
jgi:hypothetical protein